MYKTKLFSALALCSLVAISSACSKNEQTAKSDDQDSQKIAGASKEDLEQAVSDRDELLSLVNEISNGLADIKNLENIVATDGSETPSQKAKIRQDIAAIQAALEAQEKGQGTVIDCNIFEGELVRPMVNGGKHITEFLVN